MKNFKLCLSIALIGATSGIQSAGNEPVTPTVVTNIAPATPAAPVTIAVPTTTVVPVTPVPVVPAVPAQSLSADAVVVTPVAVTPTAPANQVVQSAPATPAAPIVVVVPATPASAVPATEESESTVYDAIENGFYKVVETVQAAAKNAWVTISNMISKKK